MECVSRPIMAPGQRRHCLGFCVQIECWKSLVESHSEATAVIANDGRDWWSYRQLNAVVNQLVDVLAPQEALTPCVAVMLPRDAPLVATIVACLRLRLPLLLLDAETQVARAGNQIPAAHSRVLVTSTAAASSLIAAGAGSALDLVVCIGKYRAGIVLVTGWRVRADACGHHCRCLPAFRPYQHPGPCR